MSNVAPLLLFVCASAAFAQQGSIRVLSDTIMTQPPAASAVDVRWASDTSVFLTTIRTGLVDYPLTPSGKEQTVIGGNNSPSGFYLASRLAAANDYVVVANKMGTLGWKTRQETSNIEKAPFDGVVDLDVQGDQLLILGSRRDASGEWAPDAAIAWKGSLSKRLADLHPIFFSSRGPQAHIMGVCGFLELGSVRFLDDGSFIIVPGVEPGAFLYERSGKLLYTWQTDRLGFQDRCEEPEADLYRMAANPEPRFAWLNARRVLDEIIPLKEGPGLIIRYVSAGKTRWDLLVLRRDAAPRHLTLPFLSESDQSYLNADVRGNRIAFVISTFSKNRGVPNPPSRLVIAEIAQ